MASSLARGTCADAELCVPCYDPRDGRDTQSCRIGEDAPREPASGFAPCCGSPPDALGTCVPAPLLTDAQRQSLPIDTCHTYDARCVPSPLLRAGGALSACTSALTSGASVCLGSCFIDSPLSALLPRASCQSAERCVPCSYAGVAGAGCP